MTPAVHVRSGGAPGRRPDRSARAATCGPALDAAETFEARSRAGRGQALGARICVSETVTARVPGFRGRPIGDLLLRGKQDALRAFEPLRAESHADPATRSYLDAFDRLERQDPGAMPAFASLVGERPDDGLAAFHLKRLLNGATGTRIELR